MVHWEAKVANLSIPTTGLVSQLQFGALKAAGTHKYLNAAVAAFSVLGLDVGIDADSIEATIEALHPPPHRMQISKHILLVVEFLDHAHNTICNSDTSHYTINWSFNCSAS